MSDYFIGVDSGTQGTKAVLMEGKTGRVLAQAGSSYGFLPLTEPGVKEQHPKTWVAALEKTVKEVVTRSGVNPAQIKALGISGQQHGMVALDEKGKVIRPAKLWCDTSTAAQADAIVKKMGGLKKLVALTGNGLPAGFTASKIAWLKQVEPEHYRKTATFLLPHDYLNYHLTGKLSMEAGDASGTGLLDTKTRNWHPKMIAAIDPALEQKLPAIQQSCDPVGTVLPMVAKRMGLEPTTLVSAGGGDNMMGAIGTGNTKVGVVTASLGTSGTVYAYSSRPVVDSTGEIAAFCDSTGGWLPLVCTMNVTFASEVIRNLFGMDHAALSQAVDSVPCGAGGLLHLPYFQGERMPNIPNATAVYFGMTAENTTPAHMARAVMEGVAFGLNYGLDRMKDLGIRPKEIRVTGGGSNSPAWRRILASVFEADVVEMQNKEGAAFGAALQALWCHRLQRGERVRITHVTDELVKIDAKSVAKPDRQAVKLYRQYQTLHNSLSSACLPIFDQHQSVR
ncbi:MAG: xylulokinase [Candidatus Methylacidiphilales bacterium]